ncbi:methyltransferase domain-containing protein [Cellulomonas septica]|uniref:Methyltransferase domain-containing protein n=2 Tax=Cellulomonas septica TaxID=285080 RepID=A0ABX1JXZ9_9CELL|nr:methyltransferase domain-containing protein [Cellulomonas septica]NKY38746.1 methyltransferase domain-containing protein [Cellulomonas septica]
MGRFSRPLARRVVELLDVRPGQRAVDVGCGPGVVTEVLVETLGADAVSAVDPTEPFVAAVRERLPGVDVRLGGAEDLPFDDDAFDVAVASLVVTFMADPVAGLNEMRRVTRPGGRVAVSVWDHVHDRGAASTFWQAVRDVDTGRVSESSDLLWVEEHVAELCATAGFVDLRVEEVPVTLTFASFAQWWDPFLLAVGPAGAYLATLDDDVREAVRRRAAERFGPPPFVVAATAIVVLGTAA